MSTTRNNHYVPIGYQSGFLEPGLRKLAYLDLQPKHHSLPDGTTKLGKSRFMSSPKQCFVQKDLYSTFFGTHVSDQIEKRLFGALDNVGALAIRAFIGEDVNQWHEHFETFFSFIDVQKLRTPKGLDWLRAQYPNLSQNQLMVEMQELQALHCTIWTEGVREIVSALDSDVKFIISDHPVTVYNYALPPESESCRYPLDPSITLKASQTIYPLDRNHCLLLTNLEYAQDENVSPTVKRTFARNFRSSMVRTDAFPRLRRLVGNEVRQINRIIKSRARRYIAAGLEDWLDPEAGDDTTWSDLRAVLRPPESALFHFGGEMFAQFEDGRSHYQDAFGRTEKGSDFFKKEVVEGKLRPNDACGCGSGWAYKTCCKPRPTKLRPSWAELSIRERNLILFQGVTDILEINKGCDWLEVRRRINDDKIREVYSLYRSLWPIETDILQLLPKPDGRPRAVYTGILHPDAIMDFAFGAAHYFGELIVCHPFLHPAHICSEYSPLERPQAYHQEFIKTVVLFLKLMPLVETGYINLTPDPTVFDPHLNRQMLHLARHRSTGMKLTADTDPRALKLMRRDAERSIMSMPESGMRAQLREMSPEMSGATVDDVVAYMRRNRDEDPLAAVQEGLLEGEGGQLSLARMAPNFEISLYMAQATGASIVTDSPHRWREMQLAVARQGKSLKLHLPGFAEAMSATPLGFVNSQDDFFKIAATSAFDGYAPLMGGAFKYLANLEEKGTKPNFELALAARLARLHQFAQRKLLKEVPYFSTARIYGLFPSGGIQDNTVNRLLLMSSSEHHLPNVPMAFYIEKHHG